MNQSVQKIVGCKKSPRFAYKKLQLTGWTDEAAKDIYFESISESDFNSAIDKSLLQIDSIKLHKDRDSYVLAGIEVTTKNAKISKHLGQSLDSEKQSTICVKDFEHSEVKVVENDHDTFPHGFKFVSHGEDPTILSTTDGTHDKDDQELYDKDYVKLASSQKLIGVHGYFESHPCGDYITSIGLILSEEVTE